MITYMQSVLTLVLLLVANRRVVGYRSRMSSRLDRRDSRPEARRHRRRGYHSQPSLEYR